MTYPHSVLVGCYLPVQSYTPPTPWMAGLNIVRPLAWFRGNSEAAEQLFSKTNRFVVSVSNMRTPLYRCFLRHYCRWRNNFLRQEGLRGDVTRVKKKGHRTLKLRRRL